MTRDHIAINAFCFFGIELDEARRVGYLASGLSQRLTLLSREQNCQFLGPFHDKIKPAPQDPRSFLGSVSCPAWKGRGCGSDGLFNVLWAEIWNTRQLFSSSRIGDGDIPATNPLPIDETLRAGRRLERTHRSDRPVALGDLQGPAVGCGEHL